VWTSQASAPPKPRGRTSPSTAPPYIDTRPPLVAGQAEGRRYRMRYRDADVPVGFFSDTLTVTVGP
jgi:hypothetical protein